MNFTRKFRGKLKRREGGLIRSKYITLMYEIIKKLKLKIFLYPQVNVVLTLRQVICSLQQTETTTENQN